jgi:hypothetical protein
MYDIKEVSEKLRISQVAVYKQIKKKEVKNYVFKKDGKTFIAQEGIDLINQLRNEFKQVENDVKNDEKVNGRKPNEYDVLNGVIDVLKEQLKEKDSQIQQLLEQNKNNQILLKQTQDRIILLEDKSENMKKEAKTGFFAWLKKKST